MRIDGEWLLCDDAMVRPIIRGEILARDGSWQAIEFLVDTGADRTVLSAATLEVLHLQSSVTQDRLGGVGGIADAVVVETEIRFYRETNTTVVFRGQYAAIPDLNALDTSVLGRDIMSLFSVIVDQPSGIVCLLGQRHRYTIEQV
ncbi:MAG: retropepsin-like domain-containing protein [Deltaproteobacteria bacterium]|nr:retropepsin-like domain-containing protein [Deltaproteobacteria bacterium]